jgi:hypothetical protein
MVGPGRAESGRSTEETGSGEATGDSVATAAVAPNASRASVPASAVTVWSFMVSLLLHPERASGWTGRGCADAPSTLLGICRAVNGAQKVSDCA